MYILDTDVVSNLRKRKPRPTLLDWMDEVGWQELATTVLTIMEIQIGIERASRADAPTADNVLAHRVAASRPTACFAFGC